MQHPSCSRPSSTNNNGNNGNKSNHSMSAVTVLSSTRCSHHHCQASDMQLLMIMTTSTQPIGLIYLPLSKAWPGAYPWASLALLPSTPSAH